jgi:uncharacterized protein (TIGR02996 family)
MTQDDPLFQAILDDPDDDGLRFVYADLLEEHGEPERAEFIRLQCQLAAREYGKPRRPAGEPSPFGRNTPSWKELYDQQQTLLRAHEERWTAPVRGLVQGWWFHRGFIEQVVAPAAKFLANAPTLARLVPLKRLTLTEAKGHLPALATSAVLARLTALDLTRNAVGGHEVRALADSPHAASLSDLRLSVNAIGDEGLEALARSPHLRRLSRLSLRRGGIGNAGVRALAQSPLASRLTLLDLGFNAIGGWGLEALASNGFSDPYCKL